jgi:hypothetical protein
VCVFSGVTRHIGVRSECQWRNTSQYEQNETQIFSQGRKYQSNFNINKTMEYCTQLCMEMDDEVEAQLKRETYLNMQKEDPNDGR